MTSPLRRPDDGLTPNFGGRQAAKFRRTAVLQVLEYGRSVFRAEAMPQSPGAARGALRGGGHPDKHQVFSCIAMTAAG